MRHHPHLPRHLLISGLFALSVCALGCRTPTYTAQWLKPEWLGDDGPDWYSVPCYSMKKPSGTITLVNDSASVYVRLFSSDRNFAQRLNRQGFTLWLSNPKDKTQKLGIHFPIGRADGAPPERPERFLPDANLTPQAMFDMLRVKNDELEIFLSGPEQKERKSLDDAEDELGLRADFIEHKGSGEYLLEIRRGNLTDWIQPGARLLLEMESPKPEGPPAGGRGPGDRGDRRGRGGEDMPPGGMGGGGPGGMGGGRPGGMGKPGEEKDRESRELGLNKAIKLKFFVTMASGPDSR